MLYESVPRRLEAVLYANGDPTPYKIKRYYTSAINIIFVQTPIDVPLAQEHLYGRVYLPSCCPLLSPKGSGENKCREC